jgi:hypothetical protein
MRTETAGADGAADDDESRGRMRRYPPPAYAAGVKFPPGSVDKAPMVDMSLDWPEMAKFGLAAALFLFLCARLLMRG